MITLLFETHAISLDNEAGVASGHADVGLSPVGRQQATALGARYRDPSPAIVFCSDLRRSYETAEIGFAELHEIKIMQTSRLREIDYGTFTRHPRYEVEAVRLEHLLEPFPGGESYQNVIDRVRAFLTDLSSLYDGTSVLVIGHRATHDSLEHLLGGRAVASILSEPWHWRPGWRYQLG